MQLRTYIFQFFFQCMANFLLFRSLSSFLYRFVGYLFQEVLLKKGVNSEKFDFSCAKSSVNQDSILRLLLSSHAIDPHSEISGDIG